MIESLKNIFRKLREQFGVAVTTAGATAALALSVATPASAQVPGSLSFMADGITSITVSNTYGFTNLLSPGVTGTNFPGLSWTNASGSNVIVVPGTNVLTTLVRDIPLWADSTGYVPTNCNLSATIVAGAGNGSTNALIFVPLWDGVNESTVSGEQFAWMIPANGATPVTIATNGPLTRWPGAQKIRLKIFSSGTNAAASQVTLRRLRLNGFPR